MPSFLSQHSSLALSLSRSDEADLQRSGSDDADQLDLLQVLDPAVNAAATLTHIKNSLLITPMINHFKPPTITLDSAATKPNIQHPQNHHLDTHLISILDEKSKLNNRKTQFIRLAKGVRAFIVTPIGIIFTIYGCCAGVDPSRLAQNHPQSNYRIWVEICSQVLNGLFTIPGIGLFPSRIIDSWNIGVILHYARVIWKRKGRKNLEDPNDLIPSKPLSSTSPLEINHHRTNNPTSSHNHNPSDKGGIENKEDDEDPTHSDHEIQLQEEEENAISELVPLDQKKNSKTKKKLRNSQESLCKSQTWYRPHSSATHYAFPIKWAVLILLLNLGNSIFQAALCAVMWGLKYSTRPAWTTATFMALSFSCGISSGILIWRIGLKTTKKEKVIRQVSEAIRPTRKLKSKPELLGMRKLINLPPTEIRRYASSRKRYIFSISIITFKALRFTCELTHC
ncbi:hypothetical protein PSHT_04515 [Puccinia striiformis]|uniref:Uncharacterized protein n=1 Tax=Puccinia striiformis TaxID=27350 RepID=A0A2S4WCZ5_9BASI|nr:hypothetical protein PSHT_04515 [Puccinia striiformis]